MKRPAIACGVAGQASDNCSPGAKQSYQTAAPKINDIEALIPTAEEIFDRPYPPPGPIPLAWEADSIARDLADMECVRLIANALFDPPITEEEIDKYARYFGMPRRQAELEIRRGRNANGG